MYQSNDNNIIKFLTTNTPEKRKSISERLMNDHEGYVPIIVGRAEIKNTPPIKKFKYVVPRDMTFGKFILEMKKSIDSTDPNTNLFVFFSNNRLVPINDQISYLYDRYKNADGFLYLVYSVENTFGSYL